MAFAGFVQNKLIQKNISGTLIECQTVLDTDQERHFVGPNLGPNCLQKLSTDGKSWG